MFSIGGSLCRHYCRASEAPMSGRELFKHLLRQCDLLPKDARQFYKFSIKQSFKQHVSESDPERVKEIITKALDDSKWIIKKYTKKTN